MVTTKRRAIFLDRDGTLVHPYHYPSRPEHLQLYEQAGLALRTIQDLGFALVVITNQAGIARGYFTENDLEVMHNYLRSELASWGVALDGIYHCPHHPDGVIPELAHRCNCRKPQPGMLLQAARDLNLDLSNSWFLGDILDDVEAGNRAGCHTILVDIGTEQFPTSAIRMPNFVAPGIAEALNIIHTLTDLEPTVHLTYRPQSWQILPHEAKDNAKRQLDEIYDAEDKSAIEVQS